MQFKPDKNPIKIILVAEEELLSFINFDTFPIFADILFHSQSVKRSVKLVSEASHICYGFDSRHKAILAKVTSRKIRPMFASKTVVLNFY